MAEMQARKNRLDVVLLLLVSILFGGMFPLLKILEQTIPPLTLTLLRTSFAPLLMLLTVGPIVKRSLLPLRTHWRGFAVLGMLLGLFLISISEGEERISASLGALMASTVPCATFLITTLVMRWEAFSWVRFAGTHDQARPFAL